MRDVVFFQSLYTGGLSPHGKLAVVQQVVQRSGMWIYCIIKGLTQNPLQLTQKTQIHLFYYALLEFLTAWPDRDGNSPARILLWHLQESECGFVAGQVSGIRLQESVLECLHFYYRCKVLISIRCYYSLNYSVLKFLLKFGFVISSLFLFQF